MYHVVPFPPPLQGIFFPDAKLALPFLYRNFFCPCIDNLQIRVVFIWKWLVGCILHLLVVLLEQSLIDLHGWGSKGDTGDEVL